MPVRSITNNLGYRFDLTQSSRGALEIQVEDKFGINQGKAQYVCITDLTSEEQDRLEKCSNEDKLTLFQELVGKRLSAICSQPSTQKSHRVQYYIHEGNRWVILGNSGLLGGVARRPLAIVASGAQLALAAGLAFATGGAALPLIGVAGLAGGGMKSLCFSVTSREEDLTCSNYMTQTASGVAGGVGGAVAAAAAPVGGGVIVGTMLHGGIGAVGQTISSSLTEAAITQDSSIIKKQLQPKELIKTAATGAITGMVTNPVNTLMRGALGNAASQSRTLAANPVLTSAAIGGFTGATTNLCSKTIENLIKRANFLDISDRAPSRPFAADKLYVYPQPNRNAIVFFSITNGAPIITEITNLSGFDLSHQEMGDISFEPLLNKLRKGKEDLTKKEKEMILKSAYKRGHIPPSITKDFGQAATIGAISGTATQLGNIAGNRMAQRQTEVTPPSSSQEKQEKIVRPEIRPGRDEFPPLPKREGSVSNSRTAQKIVTLLKVHPTPLKEERRTLIESKITHVLDKITRFKNPIDKGKAPDLGGSQRRVTRSMGESFLAAGQKRSREVAGDSGRPQKTLKSSKTQPVSREGKKVSEESRQPASTSQVQAIQGEIHQLESQQTNLKILASYSPVDIENKATEIYNNAKNSGAYGKAGAENIGQQLSDLYGIPVGSHNSSFEQAYKGRNKDTHVVQAIMDVLLNEQATKAVSNRVDQNLTEARSNLQCAQDPSCFWEPLAQLNTTPKAPPNILELITDSENVARNSGFEGNIHVEMYFLATYLAGGVDHGPLFNEIYNTYSNARSYWEAHSHEKGAPTQYGFLTYVTDQILNGESTVPVEQHHNRWYNKALDALGGKVSFGIQTDGEGGFSFGTMDHPDLFRLPGSNGPGSEQINSLRDPSENSSGGILTTDQYGSIELGGHALEQLNRIPGAQGLGSYAQQFVGRLTGFLGFLDRLSDSDYQNAPFLQRITCAGAGAAVEGAGSAILAPLSLFALLFPDRALAIMAAAEKEGDNAQGMCNEFGDWVRN